jgi:Crinkler effector protein N-terminal domain
LEYYVTVAGANIVTEIIMPTLVQVNCLVLGEDRSDIFTIEIEDTNTVSILKSAIRDANNVFLAPKTFFSGRFTCQLTKISKRRSRIIA